MDYTNDKIEGTFNSTVGKVKEGAGNLINDKNLQAEGTVQKNMGKGQQVVGVIKEKFQQGTHSLGDGIEKFGKKLQEKGYEKFGVSVEKAGDKLEHMAD